MTIDIDSLTEQELFELNIKIIERVKHLHQRKYIELASQFRMGDIVSFNDHDNKKIFGIITSIRKKSFSVLSEANQRWNISPHLLTPQEKAPEKLLKLFKDLLPPSILVASSSRKG